MIWLVLNMAKCETFDHMENVVHLLHVMHSNFQPAGMRLWLRTAADVMTDRDLLCITSSYSASPIYDACNAVHHWHIAQVITCIICCINMVEHMTLCHVFLFSTFCWTVENTLLIWTLKNEEDFLILIVFVYTFSFAFLEFGSFNCQVVGEHLGKALNPWGKNPVRLTMAQQWWKCRTHKKER